MNMRLLTALFSPRISPACWRVGSRLSAYVDGALAHAARREVSVHLRECRKCALRYEELSRTRDLMKKLPSMAPPPQLSARLRAMASKEAAHRRTAAHQESMAQFAMEGMKLRMSNLMRPLALPFAGGLVSAMVLFSMLVPSFPAGAARNMSNDVPTAFYQEPSVKSVAPFGISDDEIVVEVMLDDQGQVIGYNLPQGKVNAEIRSEIENTLLFARFTPALSFGQPMAGKLLLSFRRSRIDVKG